MSSDPKEFPPWLTNDTICWLIRNGTNFTSVNEDRRLEHERSIVKISFINLKERYLSVRSCVDEVCEWLPTTEEEEWHIDIQNAVPKGENYICDVYRVTIRYKGNHDRCLIVKVPKPEEPDDPFERASWGKETKMYNVIMPKFRGILNEDIGPDCLRTEDGLLVLEDLKSSGYSTVTRSVQLDFQHTVITLKALAKFHAASVRLHEVDPRLIEEIGNQDAFREFLDEEEGSMSLEGEYLTATEVGTWPEGKHYEGPLQEFAKKCWSIACEQLEPKESDFKVLNHGDFWITNMMFHYLDEIPTHCKIIDFQILTYTTPAFDIISLMESSVQTVVRAEKYDQLIHVYVNSLNNDLELCGSSKKLSFSELKNMINERRKLGLSISLDHLPLVLSETDQQFDFSEEMLKSLNKDCRGAINNKNSRRILLDRIKEYEKLGCLS